MKVNIVTEGMWIKHSISHKLEKYSNKDEINYSISESPRIDTDINFYICYNTYLQFQKSKVLDIGYVTHIHANDTEKHSKDIGFPFAKFKELDFYLHESNKSYNQFIQLGFLKEKNRVVYAPIEMHKYPTSKIKLGIIQNGEVEGKGLFFMEKLINTYNFSDYFKFIISGNGWEKIIKLMKEKNIDFELYLYQPEDYYNLKHKDLYCNIDYLFVPSLWEGGPIAILEALSCSVPIISSDVGLVKDFGVEYMYKPGNIEEACKIFNDLSLVKINRKLKVTELTYEKFNHNLYKIFTEIIDSRKI